MLFVKVEMKCLKFGDLSEDGMFIQIVRNVSLVCTSEEVRIFKVSLFLSPTFKILRDFLLHLGAGLMTFLLKDFFKF